MLYDMYHVGYHNHVEQRSVAKMLLATGTSITLNEGLAANMYTILVAGPEATDGD